MKDRLPSDEELVDLSWLLDSALVVGDRARATDSATRLLKSLRRHREGLAGLRPQGGTTTMALRHSSLNLSADVASILTLLNGGDTPPPVEFRHRVQAMTDGCLQGGCHNLPV